jgi:hypothetical protein
LSHGHGFFGQAVGTPGIESVLADRADHLSMVALFFHGRSLLFSALRRD